MKSVTTFLLHSNNYKNGFKPAPVLRYGKSVTSVTTPKHDFYITNIYIFKLKIINLLARKSEKVLVTLVTLVTNPVVDTFVGIFKTCYRPVTPTKKLLQQQEAIQIG